MADLVLRGGAHHPRADAEAGGGGFEQFTFMLVGPELAPAVADDFAIKRSAHVADHVRFHNFSDSIFL